MNPSSDTKGMDRLLLFLAGALICVVVGCSLAYFAPHSPWIAATAAMAAVVVIAAVKGIHDVRVAGTLLCSWNCLYIVAGGCAASWFPWLVASLLAIYS